ncbi:hypothetical protein K474DRAFT_1252881 [Panus rudis PR-1116 ss-1]|nr:hypothetical protein K474DRAFT_1252881 [Panus rudis PR-1116 ss-1]
MEVSRRSVSLLEQAPNLALFRLAFLWSRAQTRKHLPSRKSPPRHHLLANYSFLMFKRSRFDVILLQGRFSPI